MIFNCLTCEDIQYYLKTFLGITTTTKTLKTNNFKHCLQRFRALLNFQVIKKCRFKPLQSACASMER